MHDVTPFKVHTPPDCICMYEALNFSDPVVANFVIDQLGVESILLLPNDNRAIDLLADEVNVPTNCKCGVTLEGDIFYPSPNYRMYSGRSTQAKYLQVDTKERIK